MKFYKTCFLIFATLCLIGYLAYYRYNEEHSTEDLRVYRIDQRDLSRVMIKNRVRGETVVLLKEGKEWKLQPVLKSIPDGGLHEVLKLTGDIALLDASVFFVNSVLGAISNVLPVREIDLSEGKRKEFGLENPRLTVYFVLRSGESYAFEIGDPLVFGGNTYFYDLSGSERGSSERVFVCNDSIYRVLGRSFAELRARELVVFKKKDIDRITVGRRKTGFTIKKSLIGWSIVKPIVDHVNELEINKFLIALTTTNVKKFLVDHFSADDLKKFKLHRPLLAIDIELNKERGAVKLHFSNPTGSIVVANLRRRFIAEIDSEAFERFYVSLQELRDNRLVHFNRWEAFGIEVKTPQFVTVSRKKGDGWVTLQTFYGQSQVAGDPREIPLGKEEIDAFIEVLRPETISDFVYSGKTPDLKRYGLLSPGFEISLYGESKGKKERVLDIIYIGKSYRKGRREKRKLYFMRRAKKSFIYGVDEKIINSIPLVYTQRYRVRDEKPVVRRLIKTGSIKKLEKPFTRSDRHYKALIKTKKGDIEVEFFHRSAPLTVSNFLNLARNGFYDNLKFHRVTPGFLVQTGDPRGSGNGGPGYTFRDEISGRKHLRGTVSMARATRPDTNGSQFFICLAPQPHLDNTNSVFGRVVNGMNVVDRLVENDEMISVKVYEILD